jgi:hypothetical protein
MGRKCIVCGNKNSPLFELPGKFDERNKWLAIIAEFCGNFSKTQQICNNTIFIIFYTDISNISYIILLYVLIILRKIFVIKHKILVA